MRQSRYIILQRALAVGDRRNAHWCENAAGEVRGRVYNKASAARTDHLFACSAAFHN